MKKYIFNLCALFMAAATITSCTEEAGTEPGSDSKPSVIIYQYEVSRPYNADNDVALRFAANNKTEAVYYLVEKSTEQESKIASMGESGYWDYVVSNGKKVDGILGESTVDMTITDLYGTYSITAVAVAGNQKVGASISFTGLDWSDVVKGTYHFGASKNLIAAAGLTDTPTTLQQCTTDETLYRFKDVFGVGYSLKIRLLPDYTATDEDGTYTYFRVPRADTPYTYGNHGAVGVRDIGYWQGNDAWVTDNGYESGMYEDHYCFVYVQYFVSAGNLGYGYDFFIPEE